MCIPQNVLVLNQYAFGLANVYRVLNRTHKLFKIIAQLQKHKNTSHKQAKTK